MKAKRTRVLEWLRWILFLVVVIVWGVGSVQAQTIGKTIDKSNYQEYKDLLIPIQLRWAENGEWTYPTGKLRFPYRHADHFLKASEKNEGKFDITENANLIEKGTGKYPEYNVYGFPFPNIDPKDPRAGAKIMWNFNFQKYRLMGQDQYPYVIWVGKSGPDGRYFKTDVSYIYYQGRTPGQEIKRNPEKFLYQDLGNIREPMDLRGTTTMSWEYVDERDNSVFNYISAIRRVRRTSGAARSDPYMGSDSWWDGTYNWGGKNPSFKWKLLGERTILVPFESLDKLIFEEAPDGTMSFDTLVKYGYETPGWKGAPWAHTQSIWVPRPVWIVEGMPKDPYYAYGKHIFYVDKEVYQISTKEVYDKAGEFWHLHTTGTVYGEGPSGNNTAGFASSMTSVDAKIPHASAIPVHKNRVFMPTSRLGPDYFTLSNMLQLSK